MTRVSLASQRAFDWYVAAKMERLTGKILGIQFAAHHFVNRSLEKLKAHGGEENIILSKVARGSSQEADWFAGSDGQTKPCSLARLIINRNSLLSRNN